MPHSQSIGRLGTGSSDMIHTGRTTIRRDQIIAALRSNPLATIAELARLLDLSNHGSSTSCASFATTVASAPRAPPKPGGGLWCLVWRAEPMSLPGEMHPHGDELPGANAPIGRIIGGHNVPLPVRQRRFPRSIRLLVEAYAPAADQAR